MPWTPRCGLVLAMLGLGFGCSTPASRFEAEAEKHGLQIQWIVAGEFEHAVFHRAAGAHAAEVTAAARRLHVYLGGDGTPVVAGRPAKDPTPRNPVALRLLILDPGPAILLGRPCYHRGGTTSGCRPRLWTEGRYSEAVVASMAAALRRYLDGNAYDAIVWFGYSGGGTLALLLAPRFPESVGVVTVAANLDLGAWTRHHRHPPLARSLDAARQPALPERIKQWHYAGAKDRVVPPSTRRALLDRWQAVWVEVPGYDHGCCWEDIWPDVLGTLSAALAVDEIRIRRSNRE